MIRQAGRAGRIIRLLAPLLCTLLVMWLSEAEGLASGLTLRLERSPAFTNDTVVRVTLTNDVTSGAITEFSLSIGDTSQYFDFALNESGAGITFTQLGPTPLNDANDGVGSELVHYNSFSGFGPGKSFHFDLDIDPDNNVGFGRPFFETLFDRNGADQADNTAIKVKFADGTSLEGKLPDFAAIASDVYVVTFLGANCLPSAARSSGLTPPGTLLAAGSASPEPIFSRAYLRPDSLCFNSPIELDWESLARREFKSFPIDDPPRDQLQSHLNEIAGDSIFTFSAALPPHLEAWHFYVLTETGPQPIVPDHLVGSIRYSHRPPAKPGLAFDGEVCLPPPPTVEDAGFVVATRQPASWHEHKADLMHSGSMTLVRLGNERFPVPPPGFDAGAIEVKSAYLLSQAEERPRYLVVRRAAECPRVCCEFTYDVYRYEPNLPVVASNTYGCDM